MSHFISEASLFQEAEILKQSSGRALFRMILQTVDERNQNKRVYPKDVMEAGLHECDERMRRRAFFGELDHPFPQGNHEFDTVRQTTVSLKEVSHIIKNYYFEGNKLIGELETTTTTNGKNLLGLLTDKAGIGMSMRGMAELEKHENTNYVKGPLLIISYDAVSLPSHSAAVVDFNEMKFERRMMTESVNQICVGGKCYLPNYFDKLVENKVIQFFDRWV
jgi:hypothetical protein